MRQMSLSIDHRPDAQLSDFSGPSWLAMRSVVEQFQQQHLKQLFFYGAADSGKSHLLAAVCGAFIDQGKSAIQVSMRELLHAPVEVLASLDQFDLAVIDDLEILVEQKHWHEPLFHLINDSMAQNNQLIFASRVQLSEMKTHLWADLASRLAQSAQFNLPVGSTPEDRIAMMDAVLKRRGWKFDPRIVEYLLARVPAEPGLIFKTLLALEPEFTSQKRKPTHHTLKNSERRIDELLNLYTKS